jgi:hypothetical protein
MSASFEGRSAPRFNATKWFGVQFTRQKAQTHLDRRANLLLLLDDGPSCEALAEVLYLDDAIRY